MAKTIHHIIHDVDRDGWGSAAMLAAQFGAENCRLYPSESKDGLALLAEVNADPDDNIWVLDIPTPEGWANAQLPKDISITWVDHHPVRATDSPTPQVRLCLPVSSKNVTTMHLLVQHGLVPDLVKPMGFVSNMCSPGCTGGWTGVMDGLNALWPKIPVSTDALPALLAGAPRGEHVPAVLSPLTDVASKQCEKVNEILESCPVDLRQRAVIVHLANAHGISLKYFNMKAREQHKTAVSVVVHRNQMLYCGRNSQVPGLNFLAHFESRGLNPKGHEYVAYVSVKKALIEQELNALLDAVGKSRA